MFYEVEVNNGEACIIGFTNNGLLFIDEHGRIPEFPLEFDRLPVTRIGEYAFCDKRITRLPESWGNITALGQLSFSNNEIFELPEDWGIVSNIGDYCFLHNNITTISNWGIIQKIGVYAFCSNEIEQINDWGDLRVISKGAFEKNNIEELTASFRNIEAIRNRAFAGNNILSEIGDMYMVPQVESDVFVGNPGDGILHTKYVNENEHYRRATGN